MTSLQRKFTMGYLILIALFDFMGLGVVVTIFPHLLLDNYSHVLPASWSYGNRLTALGIFLAIYPLGQFFGAVVLGKWSDARGRKNILLLSLIGTLVGFLLSGFAIVVSSTSLLFVSRLLSGLFAGNVAITQASMADISDENTKTRNLTLIQTALGLAWVFGPPLGGWLAGFSVINFPKATTPFLMMGLMFLILIVYTIFFYKETLLKPTAQKAHLFSGFKEFSVAYSNQAYRHAFSIWFVFVAGWWLFEAFLPTYLLDIFHFSSARIGIFLASMGATYAVFQYVVVQRLSKTMRPENMVKSALCIAGLSVIAICFVRNVIELHVVITVFVMSMGFVLPGLITFISNLATKEDQGHMMGMIASVQAIATVSMMLLGGYLDSYNVATTVIGGGALLIISWVLFITKFKSTTTLKVPAKAGAN